MLRIIRICCGWLFRRVNIIANLTAENLALRQQLLVLKRNQKRLKLEERDRLFWVALSGIWSGWRDALVFVHPDTVIRWHREGFRRYWRRKSQTVKRGRPVLDPEVRALILKMGNANPRWGAPKIHGELLKL
ncbi:MAG: integrase, partial [Candidatus Hydrogenedens sp.]|nr:integrase [Candidatus Hydrogenedens sp.]